MAVCSCDKQFDSADICFNKTCVEITVWFSNENLWASSDVLLVFMVNMLMVWLVCDRCRLSCGVLAALRRQTCSLVAQKHQCVWDSRGETVTIKRPSHHFRRASSFDVCSVFLLFSSSASLCPFFCSAKGENNEGGRRSVWPDNVKVFKGGNEEVSVLTCEGGLSPRRVSLSTPIPVLLQSKVTVLLSQHAGPWLTYIHPLSPNRQTSRCVSRRAPALCWDSSKLHKVTLASTDEV